MSEREREGAKESESERVRMRTELTKALILKIKKNTEKFNQIY